MIPDNHVDPPDLGKLLPILAVPKEGTFWTEAGKTVDWVRYLWTGPNPHIAISLRNIYPETRFSPQLIYQGVIDEVARQAIPGVVYGRAILHESGPFSPYRAYLRIRREFSEYFVCAAPVGTSFFVSVRNIDHFPHVKWFHYLPIPFLVASIFFLGVIFDGTLGGMVFVALSASLVWSIFRFAAYANRTWLSEHLPEIPFVGALYLRWFRPDTYYRQDVHAAFISLVDGAIRKVVAGLEPALPMRPDSATMDSPIRRDLHTAP